MYFNISQIYSNKVRVYTDFGYGYVDAVDIDVYNSSSSSWVDVYQGSVANNAWDESNFTGMNTTAGRFRYNYTNTGVTFWFMEFEFYNTTPTVGLPSVTTNPATAVEETTAILHGHVDGDGGETSQVRFQYGTNTSYGTDTSWQLKNTDDNFTEFLSGLNNNTLYHFRAQINNSAGLVNGSDMNFTATTPAFGVWLKAHNYTDPNSEWDNEMNVMDDELESKASSFHDLNDPDGNWSFPLYLNRTPTIGSDKVRFYAKAVGIDTINISLEKDGSWEQVYSGNFSDLTWTNVSFDGGLVSAAEIRFRVADPGSGIYWELYEFDFLNSDVNNTTVTNVLPVSSSEVTISDSIKISADVTDNDAVDIVLANITMPNTTVDQIELDTISGDTYYAIYKLPTDQTGQYLSLIHI